MNNTLSRDQPRPPLSERMRAELEDYFADDLTLLESVTGFDLSYWRGDSTDRMKQSGGVEKHRNAG